MQILKNISFQLNFLKISQILNFSYQNSLSENSYQPQLTVSNSGQHIRAQGTDN